MQLYRFTSDSLLKHLPRYGRRRFRIIESKRTEGLSYWGKIKRMPLVVM
jgi:hypothetical protein